MQCEVIMKLKSVCKCPECGSSEIQQFAEGQYVCANCGLVINNLTVRTRNSNVKIRKSKQNTIQTSGRSGIFQFQGNFLKDKYKSYILLDGAGLKMLTNFLRVSDSTEKNIALALITIIKIARNLGMKYGILETTLTIYERLAKKCTFKGKNIKAMSAAIIYAAGKNVGYPYGLREIARVAKVQPNKIFRCYKFILENLDCALSVSSFDQYISRVCEQLSLSENATRISQRVFAASRGRLRIMGAISGIIAASIYISSILTGEKRTQREIADVMGMTEATIRSKYKEITKRLQITLSI
ncbi:MAG: TFIIB-type zinc ribbon-containing protein [Candidatus Jordarchaeaceae archaeon]